MPIHALEFTDAAHRWTLDRVEFGPLNLLVGHSGAGKTRIIETLMQVARAATPRADVPGGCQWTIEVDTEAGRYRWSAETDLRASDHIKVRDPSLGRASPRYLRETVHRDGQLIVERSPTVFRLRDEVLPRLSVDESAVVLLRDIDEIQPLSSSLRRLTVRQAGWDLRVQAIPVSLLGEVARKVNTLSDLREAIELSSLTRAYLLELIAPDFFRQLVNEFRAVFPAVHDVHVATMRELDPAGANEATEFWNETISLGLREGDDGEWIVSDRISSGMLKTFGHLLDIALAPPGTVMLIDEFENSLGVNCLDAVTESIADAADAIQFIVTSHHPYIIENIPTRHWKLVTRQGGRVTVRDPADIPELNTLSSQSAFIKLLNADAFKHGIRT